MLRCYRPQSLTDLLGEEELRLLIAGVCLDVQLPVILLDKSGAPVFRVGSNEALPRLCSFCSELRQNPEADEACRDSEKRFGLEVLAEGTNDALIAHCHMNLVGIGVPIRVCGTTLGAAVTGQIRHSKLDTIFKQTISEWIPKLGRRRVAKLRRLYRRIPPSDEVFITEKQGRLLRGVKRIESIAHVAYQRERTIAERMFMADLGFELPRATREENPLQAAIRTLGKRLGAFLDAPEHCIALYEGKGGKCLECATRMWNSRQPANFVAPSIVQEAAGVMKCSDTDRKLIVELFSTVLPDLGVVVSRFEHKERILAIMFASRRAATVLKAAPYLISKDFWSDVATVFKTTYSEIEFSGQIRQQAKETRKNNLMLQRHVEKAVHDLKMPLSGILLQAEEPLKNAGVPLVKERLAQIMKFGEQLSRRVDRIMLGAREELKSIDQVVTGEEIRVRDVLERIIERYRHQIRLRKHQKQIVCETRADPIVFGDPVELETVFDNLVDNAVKYTYPSKEVRAVLDADDTELSFEIENYGLGILPDEQEKVWERYFRGKHDDAWSGAVSGSGIGLYVVRQTVATYRGRVRFESRPSAGIHHDPKKRDSGHAYLTRFFLTLPLYRRSS